MGSYKDDRIWVNWVKEEDFRHGVQHKWSDPGINTMFLGQWLGHPYFGPWNTGNKSNLGFICVHACMLSLLSHVWLFVTQWTVTCQAPLSWDFPGKSTRVDCHSLLQGSSQPRDWTGISHVSCIGRWVLYHQCHLGSPSILFFWNDSSKLLPMHYQTPWATLSLPKNTRYLPATPGLAD